MARSFTAIKNSVLSKKVEYIIFPLIILLATFLRFHNLATLPPSLNWDEAATGYNAYALLHTGKDEFGKHLPLYFKSYDDDKQPVYIYMTVASILFFGYTDFAIRFPSAFFGVGTVMLFYFLCTVVIKKKYVPLLACFLLAILPWHIQFSHYAVEANVGLFFIVFGLYLTFRSFSQKRILLPMAIIFFTIASYTYQSYRIILPLLGMLIAGLYPKQLFNKDKYLFLSLGIICFLVLFSIYEVMFIGVNNRFNQTSVLHDYATFKHADDEMLYDGTQKINVQRRIFHEIPVLISTGLVLRGYLTHFSPDFLFFDQNQRLHFAPDVGYLYIWMLPFLLFGMFTLIKEKDLTVFWFFFGWLLLAPIPASVTWDVPQGIRTLSMTIPLCFFTAVGIHQTIKMSYKRSLPLTILFCFTFSIIILFSLLYFLHQYDVHFPHEKSQSFQYGEKQMTEYILTHKNLYDHIIVSTNIDRAYMFMLYYSKYDPSIHLKEGGTVSGSYNSQKNHFDMYSFRLFDFQKDVQPKTLFVGTPADFPLTIHPIHTITYQDNTPSILFTTDEQIQPLIQKCLDLTEITQTGDNQQCYQLNTQQIAQ